MDTLNLSRLGIASEAEKGEKVSAKFREKYQFSGHKWSRHVTWKEVDRSIGSGKKVLFEIEIVALTYSLAFLFTFFYTSIGQKIGWAQNISFQGLGNGYFTFQSGLVQTLSYPVKNLV